MCALPEPKKSKLDRCSLLATSWISVDFVGCLMWQRPENRICRPIPMVFFAYFRPWKNDVRQTHVACGLLDALVIHLL
jgi:hypothetical protein